MQLGVREALPQALPCDPRPGIAATAWPPGAPDLGEGVCAEVTGAAPGRLADLVARVERPRVSVDGPSSRSLGLPMAGPLAGATGPRPTDTPPVGTSPSEGALPMQGSIRGRVIATLGVLALVAATCDGGGAPDAAAGEQAAGAPITVEVMLSDFEISPSTIQVP